jgi:glutaminase
MSVTRSRSLGQAAGDEPDYQAVLDGIARYVRPHFGRGKVAGYIPALARVPARKFGMAVHTVAGRSFHVGDAEEPFSIQSVSKVFTLTLAMTYVGEALWRRVGREPSGNPFNSLIQLEYEHGIPRNPFINPGAQVVADVVLSHAPDAKRTILELMRRLSGNPRVQYDLDVARSEHETGFRNRAMVNFMKSHGNIANDVDAVLDVYFTQCSLAMSCLDLARAASFLANRGVSPLDGKRVDTPRQTKRINALMLMCGLYDAGGNFAYRVGIPAKSGVGGGIVGVVPGECAVAVWSPELDASGSSLVGIQALELFTSRLGNSIF